MRIQPNDYNSGCFGMRMADVVDIERTVSGKELQALLQDARAQGLEHLAAKIPTDDLEATNAFLSSGFYLVDTQVEYEHMLGKLSNNARVDGFSVRFARPEDATALMDMAERSFNSTRWHSDPHLPQRLCDGYYRQWVDNCMRGYAQHILVGEHEGEAAGFMTLRVTGADGRIDLTAVAEAHRGKGHYRSMVQAALAWAREKGLQRILATTQINNLGSRRTWTSEGFRPGKSVYVLHAHVPGLRA